MNTNNLDLIKDVKKVLKENLSLLNSENIDVHKAKKEAKILCAFSAAFNIFHEKDFLIMASTKKDYFIENFFDHKFGGVYCSLDKDNKRLDTRKRLKEQALTISAMCEFDLATGDEEAVKSVKNTYEIIEKEFSLGKGRYCSVKERNFSKLDDTEDIKAYLALTDAFCYLYKITSDTEYGKKACETISMLCDKAGEMSGRVADKAIYTLLKDAFIIKDIDLINKVRSTVAVIAKSCTSTKETTLKEACGLFLVKVAMWKYLNVEISAEDVILQWNEIKSKAVSDEKGRLHLIMTCIEFLRLI